MDPKQAVDQYAKTFPVATMQYEKTMVKYGVPNAMALWRVSSFQTKEPETVKWVSEFQADDIFVDIGANMGLYTLFAAVHCGAHVYAFEPESQNYALLNRNIRMNNVADRVVAWCCALTEARSIDRLYMSSTGVAGSGHEYGAEVDPELKPTTAAFAQGSLGYALDELITLQVLPIPNHVKIDVDGIEHLVVKGASQTFQHPDLQSVLIEISPHLEQHARLIDEMAEFGFGFDPDQVERARRKEGNTKDYAEYIFRR